MKQHKETTAAINQMSKTIKHFTEGLGEGLTDNQTELLNSLAISIAKAAHNDAINAMSSLAWDLENKINDNQ